MTEDSLAPPAEQNNSQTSNSVPKHANGKAVEINPLVLAELIRLAVESKRNAYAPYSKFYVGAAVRAASGKTYTGCNVENSSYPLGCCAERCALYKAISEGERHFDALAVATDLEDEFGTPCGGCRQNMAEFGDFPVIMVRADGKYEITSVHELLPRAFAPKHLFMRRHDSPVHDTVIDDQEPLSPKRKR